MSTSRWIVVAGVGLAWASGTPAAAAAPRVEPLVGAMTLAEKVSFVHGSQDPASLGQAGFIPGVARLGIPPLRLTDGPAGVRVTPPATAMPAPVAPAPAVDRRLGGPHRAGVRRGGAAPGRGG